MIAGERTRRVLSRWLPALAAALLLAVALAFILRPRPTPAPVPAGRPGPTAPATCSGTVPAPALPRLAIPTPAPRPSSPEAQREDWLALARTFDVQRAISEVAELCRPEYGGRQAGSEGGQRAAAYLAARFAALGLLPAGDAGGYLQAFALPLVELGAVPSLTLTSAGGERYEAVPGRDFAPIASNYTGPGDGEGRVIWVNHGAHEDYDGIDAAGAVALCGEPTDGEVFRQAVEHGVAALLIMREDAASLAMGRVSIETSWISQTIPAAYVSSQVVERLLAGTGVELADLTLQYTPLPLGSRAHLTVAMREVEQAEGRNVLGFLPGRNPKRANEVVVLGAHYDHLGHGPLGEVFPGANDDASGVAALLEIARSWQAAGYIPERTVLFAAWDAEEEGLLGSRYYVDHPVFPLPNTVGMLQLDMIGLAREGVLDLDGEGPVRDQARTSAEELGIAAQPAEIGRSDHASFRERGVPATMMIWAGLDDTGTHYHRADDTPANLNPAQYAEAGALAELVALHLASSQPEVAALVAAEREALRRSDTAAFLDSVSAEERAQEEARLRLWQQARPQDVELALRDVVVGSGVATATLHLAYNEGADKSLAADYTARFVREDGSWRYAGLATLQRTEAHVRVLYPSTMATATVAGLAAQADSLYGALEQALALPPAPPATVEIYASTGDLAALYGPDSVTPGRRLLGNIALLAEPAALSETLVSLALGEAGLPSGRLTWLGAGLAALLQEADLRTISAGALPPDDLRLLAQDPAQVWSLASLPERGALPPGRAALWQAEARSLAGYLLRHGGWPGVTALARASATASDRDAAVRQALGYPLADLEARWRADTLDRWLGVQQAISDTLRARTATVASGDEAGFLATVDSANATWLKEQLHWFQDTRANPLSSYVETGTLEELAGDQALVRLEVRAQLAGEGPARSLVERARFVAHAGRWLYGGPAFRACSSAHFTLLSDAQDRPAEETLQALLASAERAWTLVHAAWPSTPDRVEIKLYPDAESFRLSIYPSMPAWATGWTEPGEAIKLDGSHLGDPGPLIAHELSHQALFAMGVHDDWLLEGVATLTAQEYDRRAFGSSLRQRQRDLADALRDHTELDFAALKSWRDVDAPRLELFYTQAWDTVSYLVSRYGEEALRRAVELRGRGASLDEAFARTMGKTLAQLLADWRASAANAHFSPDMVAWANGFGEQRALEAAAGLSGRAFGGRAMGMPGGDAAASDLAARFAASGLVPAGDAGTYLQTFPLSTTALLSTPVLSFAQPDGRTILDLRYRDEFRELVRGRAGAGAAEGEVVWVAAGEYGDADLGGRIALQRLRGDAAEAAEEAWRAGAAGLILVRDASTDLHPRSMYLPALEAPTIPVAEITNDAFVALIKASGHSMAELATDRPVLRLGFLGRLEVPLEAHLDGRGANVLGLVHGSDPALAQEVFVVGAHYDHVGALPDGTLYPGANDDASGVGVLLELARLVGTGGWQPRHSILFAAWGAEEQGLVGSSYYAAHPIIPLAQTLAMIQLDMVGQGRGYYLDMHGDADRAGELLTALALGAERMDVRANVMTAEGGSDHVPFEAQGVPAALLIWRDGENLHLPSDTPDQLDAHKLAVAGKTVAAALRWLDQAP